MANTFHIEGIADEKHHHDVIEQKLARLDVFLAGLRAEWDEFIAAQLKVQEPGMHYPVTAVHVRREETTTVVSIRSADPQQIIGWLADRVRECGFEVLTDHDYDQPQTEGDDQDAGTR